MIPFVYFRELSSELIVGVTSRLVGWLVRLKGREDTLPCSYCLNLLFTLRADPSTHCLVYIYIMMNKREDEIYSLVAGVNVSGYYS